MSKKSVTALEHALFMASIRLRESYQDYEEILVAAITGDGLEELRANSIHQSTVRRIIARRDMAPVFEMKPQKQKVITRAKVGAENNR